MNSHDNAVHAVPTNIITGFLGVGKTSAILHLLKSKPANERWAVLVNEFGEVGVDGSLFEGQHSQKHGVFIREVPGGCMCCAAGLPMQVALNQLLARAKPDRLLIEPTGLGHPKEVLALLSASHYQDILSLQKTITLVDARKLSDPRYTEHDTFNQQIAVADTVVGNKTDLYNDEDKTRLADYIQQHGQPHVNILYTQQGNIEPSQLEGSSSLSFLAPHHDHHHSHNHKPDSKPAFENRLIPESGYLKALNEGEGFESVGWRFSPEKTFNHDQLYTFLTGIVAERMKAVFITDKGIFGYNLTSDALTELALDDCMESRIEIISTHIDDTLESQILDCIER